MSERERTPLDALADLLSEDMAGVAVLIRERMASEHAPRIPAVSDHLFGAGGKRIRPLLCVACARLMGYSGEAHVKLAGAVEFIHTATLLHDDVVDESSERRGRPTANLLWDNKSSILTGDYLFSRAFQLMVETGSLRVLDILANASATIAEGEVLQLSAARDVATTEEVYNIVIRGKTAALFSAASEAGGVIAGASLEAQNALFDYGDALGMAFQLVDDLLDYWGTAATGKAVGGDFREGKMTLPVILALAKADAGERAFWTRVITGKQADGDLAEALRLLENHGADEATRARALAQAERARAALNGLPEGEIRAALHDLAGFVVARVA
ncbi:MAG: polyprenyl synthetase family protein [Deltaproteobacteria bacterium]